LRRGEQAAASVPTEEHGLFSELGEKFESEINKLKGLALGTMLGALRDVVASSAPPHIGPQLAEIIDSATVKLGGQPINGPVFDFTSHQEAQSTQSRGQGYA
jgi:hypothetical protein